MTSYRPVDSKREEFRKYLEKAGAMDALTKVLVMLYDEPEKPADALEYIRKHLGDNNRPDDAELNVLRADLEESRLKIQTLEDEIKLLKERLALYEPEESTAMEEGEEDERGGSTILPGTTVVGGKTILEGKTIVGGKTVVGGTTVVGEGKTETENSQLLEEGASGVSPAINASASGNPPGTIVSGTGSQPAPE